MHATSDDDPRCVVVFADEAIEAGTQALGAAKNPRQVAVTTRLLEAAQDVKTYALKHPEGM